MGHTVTSQRRLVYSTVNELKDFSRALKKEEAVLYDNLLNNAFKHIGAITYTSSMHTWACVLLSIILEQEKKIAKLEHEIMDNRRI